MQLLPLTPVAVLAAALATLVTLTPGGHAQNYLTPADRSEMIRDNRRQINKNRDKERWLTQKNRELTNNLARLESDVERLQSIIERQTENPKTSQTQASFTVSIDGRNNGRNDENQHSHIVKFNQVISDPSQLYDRQTGEFWPQVSGVYLLSLTVWCGKHNLEMSIGYPVAVSNGYPYQGHLELFCHGNGETTTVSVAQHLRATPELLIPLLDIDMSVNVKTDGAGNVFRKATFTAALISPDVGEQSAGRGLPMGGRRGRFYI